MLFVLSGMLDRITSNMRVNVGSNRNPSEPAQLRLPSTVRNVFSNWGGFAFSGIVNFFLAPFVVRHLGNTFYGISVLLMSLTGYLGLLDLGVRGAMTRYVAKFHARGEHNEASRFTSSALVIFGVAGIVAFVLALLLAVWAGSFPIPRISTGRVRILLLLAGLNVGVSLLSGVFSGIPMALQRFDQVNAIAVLTTVFRALAIVLALAAGGGLVALVCIQLVSTLAATVASAWVSFRLYPELRSQTGHWERRYLSLILTFSASSFSLLVFDTVVLYMNSLVVAALESVYFVTFFWIAANLINYSRAVVSGISKTSTPLASALEAQGDERGLQRAILSGASYSSAVILPIAATFLLRGKHFIGLWMGPEYADLSGRVLWILTVGLVFSASNQVAVATLLGISKHKALVPVFLGQALSNLAISGALVHRMGIIGVAWGTTLPYLAISLLFWPWYVRHTLGIPIQTYLLSIWARPAIAVAPFACCSYAVDRFWSTPNLFLFFLQTGAILPLAFVGFWYACLTHLERQTLSQTLLQPAFKAIWPRSRRRAGTLP